MTPIDKLGMGNARSEMSRADLYAMIDELQETAVLCAQRLSEQSDALTSLIAERDGLASLLRAFVNVRDQFPESVKLIDTAFDEYSPITVTVTKAQFLAARTALEERP